MRMLPCRLCERKDVRQALRYGCFQCGFQLCMECGRTSVRSTNVKYEDHDQHYLYFVNKIHIDIEKCDGSDTYCKLPVVSYSDELRTTHSSVLRCLACDFKVHLLCGPLPNIIKHMCHVDSLIVVDSLIEDNSRECYCDVCETKKDPQIHIYYC